MPVHPIVPVLGVGVLALLLFSGGDAKADEPEEPCDLSTLPEPLKTQVATAIAIEVDPDKLDDLADAVDAVPCATVAAILREKAQRIRDAYVPPVPPPDPPPPVDPVDPPPTSPPVASYVIKSGDRPDLLAARFGSSLDEMQALNGLEYIPTPQPVDLILVDADGFGDETYAPTGRVGVNGLPIYQSSDRPGTYTFPSMTSPSSPGTPQSTSVGDGTLFSTWGRWARPFRPGLSISLYNRAGV